ncbi:hypothetical protein V6N13_143651 [Hibiscus sabdariffa]|uniref:GDSL esterase/lipase n=1 Tax=Hibiscus sabdariffa TaxID=183260 RepID=A0ABR2FI09_9ROSI
MEISLCSKKKKVDFIFHHPVTNYQYVKLLGFHNYTPPYSTASGQQILGGVNYASAAAGIREETGQQLTLYNYGARKFVLIGVGQIGCSPNELAQNTPDAKTCVERINVANQIFNDRLKGLVDQFNNANSDAKFIYINAYGIFQRHNEQSFGLG